MHLRARDFSKGVSCQLDPKCCGLTDLEHGCFLGNRSAFWHDAVRTRLIS